MKFTNINILLLYNKNLENIIIYLINILVKFSINDIYYKNSYYKVLEYEL